MDPESKDLLRKNLELAKENNKMLRRMRREAIFGFLVKLLIWALVLGVPIYLYFMFVEPRVEEAKGLYEDVQSGVADVKTFQERILELAQPLLPQAEE